MMFSVWEGLISGAILVFGGVCIGSSSHPGCNHGKGRFSSGSTILKISSHPCLGGIVEWFMKSRFLWDEILASVCFWVLLMLDFIHHQIFRILEAESNKIFCFMSWFCCCRGSWTFVSVFFFRVLFLGGIFFSEKLSCFIVTKQVRIFLMMEGPPSWGHPFLLIIRWSHGAPISGGGII